VATRAGSPPDLDLARIRRFAQKRLPAGLANEVRLEVEVEGASVTMVERRPPWSPDFGPEWSHQPIAQLRFDAARSTWALLWPRANGLRQRCELPPTTTVDRLLAELDADPEGVFWG
jgi:DUF3024 family protein